MEQPLHDHVLLSKVSAWHAVAMLLNGVNYVLQCTLLRAAGLRGIVPSTYGASDEE